MVILSTADEKGRCYIETKNLDGETNKKIKFSHKDIFPFTKDLSKIDVKIIIFKDLHLSIAILKHGNLTMKDQMQLSINLLVL